MAELTLICDRCKEIIVGRAENTEYGRLTSGFYERKGWEQFFNPGEFILCDGCVQSSPHYKQIYGRIPSLTPYL
jgi:hypothetical protein